MSGNLEEMDDICHQLLDSLIFDKIISQDSDSIIVKIENQETGEEKRSGALKIIRDLENSEEALRVGALLRQILERIKSEILDSMRSPCFLRCDHWLSCSRVPQIDKLGPSYLQAVSPEDRYLYLFVNDADFNLLTLPYQLTQFEMKCLMFELLYSLQVASNFSIPVVLRMESILIASTDVDRLYTVNGRQFRLSSQYLPIFSDFSKDQGNQEDNMKLLLEIFGYLINSKLDLSELFVDQFENLGSYLSDLSSISDTLFQSSIFKDLTVNSNVSLALKRQDMTVIEPLS